MPISRGSYPARLRRSLQAPNQPQQFVARPTFDGGQNTRFAARQIGEDQATKLLNIDIGVPGRTDKRLGVTLIANDVGTRTDALIAYYPTGGDARIYRSEGGNLRKWTGSGDWSSNLGTHTSGTDVSLVQGGESGENEVIFLQDNSGNPQRINSSDTFQDLGSGSTSPIKTPIQLFWRNRWWLLLNGFLYYSDAFSTDYSTAFDGANGFRFSGQGDDKGLPRS